MIIGLDWDGTWTRDPDAWEAVVRVLWEAGHGVVIATGNRGGHIDRELVRRFGMHAPPVVRGKPKHDACMEAGHRVDVWIDNEPGQAFMSQEEWVPYARRLK